MAATFLIEMQAQLKALEAELERHPTYRKYELLRTTYNELYEAWENFDRQERPRASTNTVSAKSEPVARSKRDGSKAALVSDAAAEWFAFTGKRAQSSIALEELSKRNVEITGSKPSATLAAVLSNDDRFDNARDERGIGYGLKSWSIKPAEPVRSASPLFDEPVGDVPAPSAEDDANELPKPVQDAA